jgi:hypothetical protein
MLPPHAADVFDDDRRSEQGRMRPAIMRAARRLIPLAGMERQG